MNVRLFAVLVLLSALGSALVSERSFAQSLRYAPESNADFAYRIEITVELGDSTTTFKGVTRYHIDSVEADLVRMTYRGGLTESTVNKPQQNPPGFGNRFPPRITPPLPQIPSIFRSSTFSGKSTTTNRITMSPYGAVLQMEGDSQLPYMLGNVSLIPFEPLPNSDLQRWESESAIAVSEKKEDQSFPGSAFGRSRIFGDPDSKNVRAAAMKATYEIAGQDDRTVRVRKTVELTMPELADRENTSMTGQGEWAFDRTVNMPASIEFDYQFVVNTSIATIRIPIKMKFDRLSVEELAEIDAAAKEAAAMQAKAREEAAAKARLPLTAEEKKEALDALASNDNSRVIRKLMELQPKKPSDPDNEVMVALRLLADNSNRSISSLADRTLSNWDPEYRVVSELVRQYNSSHPLTSSGRTVDDQTQLFEGQLVQVPSTGRSWKAAMITEVMDNGLVRLQMRAAGGDDLILDRNKIQLAPEDLPQPRRPAALSRATAQSRAAPSRASQESDPKSPNQMNGEARTWVDATGTFKVEAVLRSADDQSVVLQRLDNQEVTVPIEKLSPADQKFLKQWRLQRSAENPFEP